MLSKSFKFSVTYPVNQHTSLGNGKAEIGDEFKQMEQRSNVFGISFP